MSALAGKHLVITRPAPEGECPLAAALRAAGARVSEIPLVEIQALPFECPPLADYQWLFFTSRNAVRAFLPRVPIEKGEGSPRIAAVGPVTAQAVQGAGCKVSFVPPDYHARAAAEAFAKTHVVQGLRILWPCGNLANPALSDCLGVYGALVTPLVVYGTRPRQNLEPADVATLAGPVDMLIFTSPSAVHALQDLYRFAQLPDIACLGPQTAAAARAVYGLAGIEAFPHTLEGLASSILRFYGQPDA